MEKCREHVSAQIKLVNPEPEASLEQLECFISELLKWNKAVNLTSISTREDCWEKHIQDSLLTLPYIHHADTMLDIGSGAGFPSIPIKLCCPHMYIVSADKVRKKINFQNHCKRKFNLTEFDAMCARIESLTHLKERFEVVIARALAPLEILMRLGGEYVRPGGILLAMKSNIDATEIELGQTAGIEFGMKLDQVVTQKLLPSGAERKLVIMKKIQ